MIVMMVMDLGVSPGYTRWWVAICLSPLGMDESDNDDGGELSSQPSKEDDHMDVHNPIHDVPSPIGGLDVLAATTYMLVNTLY